jgi:hypothetical protein
MNSYLRYSVIAVCGLLAARPVSANFIDLTGRGGGGGGGWALGQIDFSATVHWPTYAGASTVVAVPGGPSVGAGFADDGTSSASTSIRLWLYTSSMGPSGPVIFDDITLFFGVPQSGVCNWAVPAGYDGTGELDFAYNFDGYSINGSGTWWLAGLGYGQPTGGVPDTFSTLVAVAAVFAGLLLIRSLAPRLSPIRVKHDETPPRKE